ncbi:polyphosphate polymerase domain-containing protein [Glutamicibacter sp. MNS18]|uniref:polyphosphate polymerase domain-containing protein n=1 Tax=Glutamicibacter sp. MNS18 TaxID=2989817 RepID=UPI002235E962|nr:polyphosphate polymerase domain-containing protein [Glutamicibacter sp. MNS18]MCW4465994.1 polyphosphate polymerase domain-containing protein [Glutamicibacter sp. MNS18]
MQPIVERPAMRRPERAETIGKARAALEAAVAHREPIGLDEVIAEAALQTRVDRKFLLTPGEFTALARRLGEEFRIMEIDGLRTFRYESVYFDTEDFEQYRAHRQGRRRRYKVRSRTYADTGLSMFEIKTKGLRGATVKHRIEQDPREAGMLTEHSLGFLDEVVTREYGEHVPPLQPVLDSSYVRGTFVNPLDGERVTCDVELSYANDERRIDGPDLIVVETKSADGRGVSDQALAELGIRPVSMSKYCIGIALLNPQLPANKWSRLLHQRFNAPQDSRGPRTRAGAALRRPVRIPGRG